MTQSSLFATVMNGGLRDWLEHTKEIRANHKLEADLKAGANDQIARALGLNFQSNTKASADFLLAQSLGIAPSQPDTESYTDEWTGVLNGTQLHLHEAHLKKYRRKDNDRSLETVFRGVVLGYQFSIPFRSITVVERDLLALSKTLNERERMENSK
jgi:hypothetical protein